MIKKFSSLTVIIGAILFFLSCGMMYWLLVASHYVSTDNAYVKSDIIIISPKVNGYLTKIHVQDHQQVQEGDLLAEIDSRDYKAQLAQAQGQLDAATAHRESLIHQSRSQEALIRQAQAGLQSAEATYQKADKEFKRAQALAKGGALAQQTLEGAQAQYKNARASLAQQKAAEESARLQLQVLQEQLKQAEAQLEMAQAGLELAHLNVDYTMIRAPQAGILGNRSMQVGQLVKAGSALVYLITPRPWIEANFKENQIEKMRVNQPVQITLDAYSNREFKGYVESLAPASGSEFSLLPPENATGNFTKIVRRVPVKIRFADEENVFKKVAIRAGLSSIVTVKVS